MFPHPHLEGSLLRKQIHCLSWGVCVFGKGAGEEGSKVAPWELMLSLNDLCYRECNDLSAMLGL